MKVLTKIESLAKLRGEAERVRDRATEKRRQQFFRGARSTKRHSKNPLRFRQTEIIHI